MTKPLIVGDDQAISPEAESARPLHLDERRLLADRLRWIYGQRTIGIKLAAEICNEHLQKIIHFLDDDQAVKEGANLLLKAYAKEFAAREAELKARLETAEAMVTDYALQIMKLRNCTLADYEALAALTDGAKT